VTCSGGEPLLQHGFLAGFLRKCREKKINTCIDTALNVEWEYIEELLEYTDMFLVDIKAMDTKLHRRLTGVGNERILYNLKKLSEDFSSGTWFLSGNEEKPVEPRCYRKSIYGYLKKASVHQAHPHALRHTFATTCLQAHCDIKTLSELLGHADAAVTLKKYVHSDMTRKRREINRIFENF